MSCFAHYEHRTVKLDLKDNEFSTKKFQKVRQVSTHGDLLESFGRIGMRINNKSASSIPTDELTNVCFIIINDYDKKGKELGVGPLNDGYLIGLKHHRLGFKVFYFYNSRFEEFTPFLKLFMEKTTDTLTVFYSGRDNNAEGIEFNNGTLPRGSIAKAISLNENTKNHILFITDCLTGGSVFDIHKINPKNFTQPAKLISFFVNKSHSPDSK